MKWIDGPLMRSSSLTSEGISKEKNKMYMASTSTSYTWPGRSDEDDYLDGGGGDFITDSEDATGSEDLVPWIQWFCGLEGNEFLCEVDDEYIRDDFNLTGLSSQVHNYENALSLILDAEFPNFAPHTDEQNGKLEAAAAVLYGLIHARYILTSKGMNAMLINQLEKYKNTAFGKCPKYLCCHQAALPVGKSDNPRICTVKIYCPKCEDVYDPKPKYEGRLDGAYFGTTFPHLFLMTYPHMKPVKSTSTYVPRIFGFKIHNNAEDKEGFGEF